MYGVPADLDLSRFRGTALTQVCLGDYQIQFRFSAPGRDDAMISVEGSWTLTDAAGRVVDKVGRDSLPYSQRPALSVNLLLSRAVKESCINTPESFSLSFDSGHTLTIFDDSEQYESFSIQPGDTFI